jgi:hypothetical protein
MGDRELRREPYLAALLDLPAPHHVLQLTIVHSRFAETTMNRVPTDRSMTRLTGIVTGLFFAVFFSTLPQAPLSAQSPTDRVLRFQESASGFQLLGSVHEANLSAGQGIRLTATLVEGADYMIVGFCDPMCSNLDLALFDPEEAPVQEDKLPDAEPVLMFTAEVTGSFTIQADAVSCSSATCEVSVGLFGSTSEPGVIPGEDMESRMTLLGEELKTMGFTPTDQRRRGALPYGGNALIPVDLVEGVNYRMVGVCDQDCPDLDLTLIDPKGVEVDGDYLDDAVPILAFIADTTASYTVDVTMVACFVDPCQFRLEVFSQANAEIPGMKTFSGRLLSHETHEGELSESDETVEDAYIDSFEVEAEAGHRIVLDLRSPEFDTLLRIVPPEGKPVENDDFRGEAEHSHIEFLVTTSGVHTVHVTSYQPFAQGDYVLQVAVVQ